MKHYNFPTEAYKHIMILQYAFGVQNIVYACKLSFDNKPYIELYFFASRSDRKDAYITDELIDLTKTLSILENICKHTF